MVKFLPHGSPWRGLWLGSIGALFAAATWSCATGDEETAASVADAGGAQTGQGSSSPDASPSSPYDDAGTTNMPDPGEDAAEAQDANAASDDAGNAPDDAPATAPLDASPYDAGSATPPDAAAPVDASSQDAGIANDAGCTSAALVVNEVQTSGPGGAEDEWVELLNPGTCSVDVSGWELRHTSISGTSMATVATIAPATTIAGGGYGVIGGTAYSASAPTIAKFSTGVLADTGGGVGLYDASSTLVGSMGYGSGATNPFVRGSAATVEGSGQSIARVPNGADTGNDSTDFKAATPTPGAAN
jgi:hypothetical protein